MRSTTSSSSSSTGAATSTTTASNDPTAASSTARHASGRTSGQSSARGRPGEHVTDRPGPVWMNSASGSGHPRAAPCAACATDGDSGSSRSCAIDAAHPSPSTSSVRRPARADSIGEVHRDRRTTGRAGRRPTRRRGVRSAGRAPPPAPAVEGTGASPASTRAMAGASGSAGAATTPSRSSAGVRSPMATTSTPASRKVATRSRSSQPERGVEDDRPGPVPEGGAEELAVLGTAPQHTDAELRLLEPAQQRELPAAHRRRQR